MRTSAPRHAHDDVVLSDDVDPDDATEGRVAVGPWAPRRAPVDPIVAELLLAHRESSTALRETLVTGFDRMHDDLGGMHADISDMSKTVSTGMRQGANALVIVCVVAMLLVAAVVVGSITLKMPGVSLSTQGQNSPSTP